MRKTKGATCSKWAGERFLPGYSPFFYRVDSGSRRQCDASASRRARNRVSKRRDELDSIWWRMRSQPLFEPFTIHLNEPHQKIALFSEETVNLLALLVRPVKRVVNVTVIPFPSLPPIQLPIERLERAAPPMIEVGIKQSLLPIPDILWDFRPAAHISPQYPFAVPSERGSAAPSIRFPSAAIAATSPMAFTTLIL